jgi:ABC-type bacteriocin/lantibiotic exporter with double-glycine peptidase domain
LDECTSNLDKETTEIIVESIKDNFPNKTIILVAHQVVSGMFDEVIQF